MLHCQLETGLADTIMLSSVDSLKNSGTLGQRGDSLWQRGDMVLDVDPPTCAHLDRLPETPSSGMGTNDAVRAVQEPKGQDQGLEPRNRDGEFSSTQENTSTVWQGLMSVKQWLPGRGKRYRDDRNSLLVIETRQYLPTTGRPSVLIERS